MKSIYGKSNMTSILLCLILLLLIPIYAQGAGEKPIELKFASISSPTHILNVGVHEPWIKQIETATNGRVKITLFPGKVLGGSKQAYDIASKSIADISYGWVHYYPGRFPLTEVFSLPGMMPTLETAHHMWDVYQKHLQKEWSDTKLLWLGTAPGYNIQTRDKKINTVEDIKGLKLAVGGTIQTEVAKVLGAIPVDITSQDIYTALQRGVADGHINTWSSAAANRHGEVMKYFTKNARLYSGVFFCVMNLDTYNSLPSDIKQIIDDNTGKEMWANASAAYWNDEEISIKKVAEQAKGKAVIYDLPQSELEKIQTLVKPMWENWVKSTEEKGLPGKEVLETATGYIELGSN